MVTWMVPPIVRINVHSVLSSVVAVHGLWMKVSIKSNAFYFNCFIVISLIITGIPESSVSGCGQAKIQSLKMKMVYVDGAIETTYGCTPTFGADRTLKLLVKSASESCKLKIVSWYLKNRITNVFVFLGQCQDQTTTGDRNSISRWNSKCRTRFLGMVRHCYRHPRVYPHCWCYVSFDNGFD